MTGQLGTAASQLANIELGVAPGVAGNIYEPEVDHTLGLSQSATVNIVVTKPASNTLTFTQTLRKSVHKNVSQSLTFVGAAGYVQGKPASNTLTFSQTVTLVKVIRRTVVQGLFLVHSHSKNYKLHKSVQHSFLTQHVVGYRNKPIHQTITFTQSVVVSKRKAVKHTLLFEQLNSVQIAYGRQVNTLFQPFQTVARTIRVAKTISQALGLVQQVVVHKVSGATSIFVVVQSATATVSKGARNTLNLAHSVTVQCKFKRTVEHVLSPTQDISKAIALARSVNSVFAPLQYARKTKVLHHSATNTFSMTSDGRKTPLRRSVSQTLGLTSAATKVRVLHRTISQQLNLVANVNRQMAYGRSVASVLSFKTYRDVPFGLNQQETVPVQNLNVIHLSNDNLEIVGSFYIEDIYGNKSMSGGQRRRNPRYVVLSVPQRNIVLPAPEFGDGENNEGIMSLRRAMDGTVRTYVKTTRRSKLSYKFTMSLTKSEELEDFIWNYNSLTMTLVNWKNEIWLVQLQKNPVELIPERRWVNAAEAVTVELDFEGIRLN